jgi:hypothetical protein
MLWAESWTTPPPNLPETVPYGLKSPLIGLEASTSFEPKKQPCDSL